MPSFSVTSPIAGNVTVAFAALSYDGHFNIGVTADAAAWPDLDLLLPAMRSYWLVTFESSNKGLTALSA